MQNSESDRAHGLERPERTPRSSDDLISVFVNCYTFSRNLKLGDATVVVEGAATGAGARRREGEGSERSGLRGSDLAVFVVSQSKEKIRGRHWRHRGGHFCFAVIIRVEEHGIFYLYMATLLTLETRF